MSIGVIILLITCGYSVVIAFILRIKDKPQTGKRKKKEGFNRSFIIIASGVVLLFVAYMMIIPTPKPGNERWFNSVSLLRYFWKTFGSLFVAVCTFGITMLIGAGIGTLFNREQRSNSKKKRLGWKSLSKEEALSAFEELYTYEIRKVNIATANIPNAHEGYYGRYNNKMEQVAKYAPLAVVRIAAVQKLRSKYQLESCLSYERDDEVRKAIERVLLSHDIISKNT